MSTTKHIVAVENFLPAENITFNPSTGNVTFSFGTDARSVEVVANAYISSVSDSATLLTYTTVGSFNSVYRLSATVIVLTDGGGDFTMSYSYKDISGNTQTGDFLNTGLDVIGYFAPVTINAKDLSSPIALSYTITGSLTVTVTGCIELLFQNIEGH